jgi:hypothetical protein
MWTAGEGNARLTLSCEDCDCSISLGGSNGTEQWRDRFVKLLERCPSCGAQWFDKNTEGAVMTSLIQLANGLRLVEALNDSHNVEQSPSGVPVKEPAWRVRIRVGT